MRPLLWRASLRYLVHHPWQFVLAIFGVALGVAVVVGIDLANGSAQRAFELSSDTVAGQATHQLVGPGGNLPEKVYSELRLGLDVRRSAPIVQGHVALAADRTHVLLMLGIDPLAEAPFRKFTTSEAAVDATLGAFLTRPGAALLAPSTASDLELAIGDRFDIDIGGAVRALELVGLLQPRDSTQAVAVSDLVVVDISTAQEVLGLTGQLTRIDIICPPGLSGEELAGHLEPLLADGVRLEPVRSRVSAVEQMTRAFRLNLQALSLLALLCGGFLIYNTMTFAVIQRRPLLATLRALGTTRRQVFVLMLGEALLIGTIGTVIGELFGLQLGQLLIGRVTQTINDLYFVVNVKDVSVPISTLTKGALLGLAATLGAAIAPSFEATSTEPREALARSVLESRVHRAIPMLSLLGALLLVTGAGLLLVPGDSLWLGFAGLFAILVGFALLTPLATVALMTALTPIAGAVSGQLGRIATRGVVTALSRTGIAIAALMMALAVTVGVDLMVGSFRGTVTRWLEYALPADLYLSVFTTPVRRFSPGGATLGQDSISRIEQSKQVASINVLRHFLADVEAQTVRAVALQLSPPSRSAFAFRRGDAADIWQRIETGSAVMVSEPFAYRFKLTEGDTLRIGSPSGSLELPIAGVFYDYSTEAGLLMLDRDLYRRHWRDDGATAISVHLPPGTDLAEALAQVRQLLPANLRVRVNSNRELRKESMRIFDRTFLITGVLRTLAVIVAFVGVLSALLALQLERTKELGVMRACGLTPGQLWRLVTQQTGLMGLTAGVLSLPVGVSMAAIMTFVINRRSFGWSLEMEIFPSTLLEAIAIGVAAAMLAGAYPAWRMARTPPAEALREE